MAGAAWGRPIQLLSGGGGATWRWSDDVNLYFISVCSVYAHVNLIPITLERCFNLRLVSFAPI